MRADGTRVMDGSPCANWFPASWPSPSTTPMCCRSWVALAAFDVRPTSPVMIRDPTERKRCRVLGRCPTGTQ